MKCCICQEVIRDGERYRCTDCGDNYCEICAYVQDNSCECVSPQNIEKVG